MGELGRAFRGGLEKLLNVYQVDFRTKAGLLTAVDPQYAKHALHDNPIGPAIDIGQVLKGLRLRNRMTQTELARRLS